MANKKCFLYPSLHPSASYVGHPHHHHPNVHHAIPMVSTKSKFTGSTKDLKGSSSSDQPPPLPQRNFTRRSQPSPTAIQLDGIDGDIVLRRNTQISDLDHSMTNLSSNDNTINNNSNLSGGIDVGSNNNRNNSNKVNNEIKASGAAATASSSASASANSKANKKRSNKTKIKANSDPKISSQLLIQMEKDYDKQQIVVATGHSVGNEPPPLPPRQPGMLEENQNFLNNNKFLGINSGAVASGISAAGNSNRSEFSTTNNSRPSPNSLDTLLNYPLIATCTAVRDNMTSAFPLSHRPNIVQQLQKNSNNNTANIHQHHSTTSSTCNKSTVSNFLLSTVT